MAFFDDFSSALKQKWLQYYQANRSWLDLHLEKASVPTPDGGRRPPSYFIIGTMNVLEPKLGQLMLPFSQLNPDVDTLIEVLGLNFDPDKGSGSMPSTPQRSQSSTSSPAIAATAAPPMLQEDMSEPVAPKESQYDLADESEDVLADMGSPIATATAVAATAGVAAGMATMESPAESEPDVGIVEDEVGDLDDIDIGVTAEDEFDEEAMLDSSLDAEDAMPLVEDDDDLDLSDEPDTAADALDSMDDMDGMDGMDDMDGMDLSDLGDEEGEDPLADLASDDDDDGMDFNVLDDADDDGLDDLNVDNLDLDALDDDEESAREDEEISGLLEDL